MSPVLLRTIYGYNLDYTFAMFIRWGGYRPNALFGNGISLTMFMLVCLIMSVAMAKAKQRISSLPMKTACLYLTVVLVLCKSTGAIIYAALALPVLLFLSPKAISRISTVLMVFFFLYPLLRFSDVIPMKEIGDYFTSVSSDRAQSLTFRFDMEQEMLDLTRQRPWFGWGGYGRNFLYDRLTGKVHTVVDGAVIASLSVRGLIGFFSYFGPFIFTLLRAARLSNRIKDRGNRILLSAMTLACSFVLFDLILNSSFPPLYMLLIGALYGLPSGIIAEERAKAVQEAEEQASYAPLDEAGAQATYS
jgi:O-antigen ligase